MVSDERNYYIDFYSNSKKYSFRLQDENDFKMLEVILELVKRDLGAS